MLGLSFRWMSNATQVCSRISAGPPLLWSADETALHAIAGALLVTLLVFTTLRFVFPSASEAPRRFHG